MPCFPSPPLNSTQATSPPDTPEHPPNSLYHEGTTFLECLEKETPLASPSFSTDCFGELRCISCQRNFSLFNFPSRPNFRRIRGPMRLYELPLRRHRRLEKFPHPTSRTDRIQSGNRYDNESTKYPRSLPTTPSISLLSSIL